jgi:hypothetical protein
LATVLDFDECPVPLAERSNSIGQLRTELPQQVGQLLFIRNDFCNAADTQNRVGMMSGSAAHHDKFCLWMCVCEFSDNLSAFRIAFGGNGTSIDDHESGNSGIGIGVGITVPQQSGANEFRFVLIDLATESEKAKKHDCVIVHVQSPQRERGYNVRFLACASGSVNVIPAKAGI